MRVPALLVSVVTAALVAGCTRVGAPTISEKEMPGTSSMATPAASQTALPTVPQNQPATSDTGDRSVEAEYNGYAFSYRKEATKTDVIFRELLPRDPDLVIGAIRDVIDRSYGEKLESTPRFVGAGAEQRILIDGRQHKYLIVPIKENTGEIRSLIITQQ